MAKIKTFEDLQVWQTARDICNDIWLLFERTPLGKDFDLRNQMSRSSGSVMDNIAEGFERSGNREFIHFLSIAKGSCGELKSQLYRALDRKHINEEQFENLTVKINLENSKLGSFIVYLNSTEYKGSKFNPSASNPKQGTSNLKNND